MGNWTKLKANSCGWEMRWKSQTFKECDSATLSLPTLASSEGSATCVGYIMVYITDDTKDMSSDCDGANTVFANMSLVPSE
jgi:hypothetical protein